MYRKLTALLLLLLLCLPFASAEVAQCTMAELYSANRAPSLFEHCGSVLVTNTYIDGGTEYVTREYRAPGLYCYAEQPAGPIFRIAEGDSYMYWQSGTQWRFVHMYCPNASETANGALILPVPEEQLLSCEADGALVHLFVETADGTSRIHYAADAQTHILHWIEADRLQDGMVLYTQKVAFVYDAEEPDWVLVPEPDPDAQLCSITFHLQDTVSTIRAALGEGLLVSGWSDLYTVYYDEACTQLVEDFTVTGDAEYWLTHDRVIMPE